jgi:hypothetical protein
MIDTYVIDAKGVPTIVKDPDAVLDYTMDWTAWLKDINDTISTDIDAVTIILSDMSGAVIASQSNTSYAATVWLSGGTLGVTFSVTFRIKTAGGRTDDRTIAIKVKQR